MGDGYVADNHIEVRVIKHDDDSEIKSEILRDGVPVYVLDVKMTSMRGALREVTGYLMDRGYMPKGSWINKNPGVNEWKRKFSKIGIKSKIT